MSVARPARVLPTRLHDLSPWRVRFLALGLFLGVSGLLFAKQDAGFTRDESFYFSFAEEYQEWFHDIEQARTPEDVAAGFARAPTMRIWSGNFEHPPLMKDLFGFSWRAFARKDRRATGLRKVPEGLRFDVLAGRATGFAEGTEVILLSQQQQHQEPTDSTRELAIGTVTKRTVERLEVLVTSLDDARTTELVSRCSAAHPKNDPSAIPITSCMARESRTLDILSESQAMRLPGILSGGLAVMLCFLFGELVFGWLVGLVGSLLFIFVPEHFFHGYLACFDMPIVAAQLLCIYSFWRALDDRRWALVTAVAWGIALLTKHNAFFVPFSLIVFWLWCGRDQLSFRWVGLRLGGVRLGLPSLPLAFLLMPVIGLTMLFTLWPRLWYDPLQSLRDWFGFHLHHEHYMQYWFGEPLQVPPFPISYPFQKTLLTYPEVFLVLLVIGTLFLAPPLPLARWKAWFGNLFRRPVSETERVAVFVLVNGLVPIMVIAMPSTPIFGGIKHWMTGAPFLALVAAYGLFRLTAALRLSRPLVALVAALVLAHPAKASIENAWLGTHYYNSLFAGGLQGAADKHLMRIFWGHEARYACDWLNANAPLNARVYWQDATWGTYEMYQREGWLRQDIRYHPGPDGADFALNEPLQALWHIDMDTREALGVSGPIWVLAQDGVPYLFVYVRPRRIEAAPRPVPGKSPSTALPGEPGATPLPDRLSPSERVRRP